MIRLAAIALVLAACSTPHAPAPAPDPPRAPREDARRFSIETVMFEMPLPIAEDLYRRAEERDSTIGAPIDEARCREALEKLSAANPVIVRAERPTFTADAGALVAVPVRVATPVHPARTLASDFLELSVRASPIHEWTDLEVETRIRWTDVHGRELGRLPSAVSPMPEGYWLEIACLPSRQVSTSIGALAVLAFLRVTPADGARARQ
jgi:hypothetical protein